MKRFIPWTDYLVYGGQAGLALFFSVLVWTTNENISIAGHVILSLCLFLFVVLFAGVILSRLLARPTYITPKHGMAVWLDNLTLPSKTEVDQALSYFALCINEYTDGEVSVGEVVELYPNIRCEFVKDPITTYSKYGWNIKDAAGLAHGNDIKVQWKGRFSRSAFFHELGHIVRQQVLRKTPDTSHKDKAWWELIETINKDILKVTYETSDDDPPELRWDTGCYCATWKEWSGAIKEAYSSPEVISLRERPLFTTLEDGSKEVEDE